VSSPLARQIIKPLLDATTRDTAAARLVTPGSTIYIDGYDDNTGNHIHQMAMSLLRADAVRVLLRRRLGSKYRYVVAGHGSSDPVATNATAAGRQRNRRVEIHYTSNCTPKYPNPC
jgi:outer membrane protein OmpA-like peptidoglycan-associated protein